MRPTHLKHLTAALITLVVTVPLTWAAVSTIRVGNPAPAFQILPSDGGLSTSETPLNFGDTVTFAAMATDVNGDDYYLAVCKTDAITSVDGDAPVCDDGAWVISGLTPSGTEVSVDYVVDKGASLESEWFAFVCDHVDLGSACSEASQGLSGETGSPFYVHKQVGVLRFGADCPEIAELDELKKSFEAENDPGVSILDELSLNLSEKDIKDLIEAELEKGDEEDLKGILKLVNEQVKTLKVFKKEGSIKNAQKDAVADAFLDKQTKLKNIAEKNLHFCVVTSTDDSLENVISSQEKTIQKKDEHRIDKEELKLDFKKDEKRTISMEFLQTKSAREYLLKKGEQVIIPPTSLVTDPSISPDLVDNIPSSAPIPLAVSDLTGGPTITYANPDDPQRFVSGTELAQEEAINQPIVPVEDVYQTINLTHETFEAPAVSDPGFLEQLFGDSEAPPSQPTPAEPVSFEMSVVEPLVIDGVTEDEVVYQSSDNRKTDIYQYKNDPLSVAPNQIKNYTIFHYGDGNETELYRFENAVLHQREDGVIEGYYMSDIDLSEREDVAGVKPDLLARASRTLAMDFITGVYEAGGARPDFTVSIPFAVDRENNVLDNLTYEITGDTFNQLQVSFSALPESYPLVLDPSVQFTAPGDGSVSDTISGSYSSENLGSSVLVADLNADGKDDLAVGAQNYTSTYGRIYIFYQDSDYPTNSSSADAIITGSSGDYLGWALTAGDMDRDGDKDLIAGSWNDTSGAGSIKIYYNDGSYTSQDIIIYGDSSSRFGYSVATKDVNNDGWEDLLTGAYYASTETGKAYIFHNDGSLGVTSCTTCYAYNADVIITGPAASSKFGIRVDAADIDSDGDNDLIVGASGLEWATTDQGGVYIFTNNGDVHWGSVTCTGTGPYNCSAANAEGIIRGINAGGNANIYQYFGFSFATNDFNGDGKIDLAIGGYGYSATYSVGKIHIFYQDGSWGTVACTTDCFADYADTTIVGGYDSFGGWVIGGDVNNDGLDDLITGAINYNSGTGQAYVFYNNQNSGTFQTSSSYADVIITGPSTYDFMGNRMDFGDLNSDGTNDLVVGANGAASNLGAAYIFYGEGGVEHRGFIDGSAGDWLGYALAVGDLNDDGETDIAASGYHWSSYQGKAYVFLQDGSYPTTSAGADYIMTGVAAADNMGSSLTIGDVNADGKDDLVIGAHGYGDVTYSYIGQLYIYYNNSLTSANDTITGEWGNYYFGMHTLIDDFNGDGKGDLVTSAHNYGTSGRMYVFYGDGAVFPDAASADDIITGQGGYLGQEMTKGDFNSDGKMDLAVGSSYNNGTGAGTVYLFYNDGALWPDAVSADVKIGGDSSMPDGYPTTQLLPMCSGDVNGDGLTDLILGDASFDSTLSNAGRMFVLLNDGSWPTDVGATDTNIIYITGGWASTGLGTVCSVADMNSDGLDDLVTGSYMLPVNGATYTGRVDIFYNNQDVHLGSTTCTGSGPYFCSTANSDVGITGEYTGDWTRFGQNLVTGDFNADGISDILVGAQYYPVAYGDGALFFLYGQRDYAWTNQYPWRNNNFHSYNSGNSHEIQGWSTGDDFGSSFAAGDFNGDGAMDLAVGAPGYNSNQGRVYIFFNQNGFPSNSTEADVILTGIANSEFGYSLASGDVSHSTDLTLGVGPTLGRMDDDIDDLVVGAPGSATYSAYIFNGRTSWPSSITMTSAACASGTCDWRQYWSNYRCGESVAVGNLASLTANSYRGRDDVLMTCPDYTSAYHFILYNDGTYDGTYGNAYAYYSASYAGYSVAIGDVDGDGHNDIVSGAPNNNTNAGQIYIYINDGNWGTTPTYIINGQSAGDRFGESVGVAPVSNNLDGKADIIVGAPGYSGGANGGKIYVFDNDGSYPTGTPDTTASTSWVNASAYSVGASMATGDLNRDGHDDVLVGAPTYSSNQGILAALYGDGGFGHNAWIYNVSGPSNSYLGTGQAVMIADLDGNGYPEAIGGAPGYDGKGQVFIWDFSKAQSWGSMTNNAYTTGTANFTLSSTTVNGSGTAWTSGMVGGKIRNNDEGEWYLITGYTSGTTLTISPPFKSATTGYEAYAIYYDNTQTGDKYGHSMATGDFDGDGDLDLAVGAPGYDTNTGSTAGNNTGRVYIFLDNMNSVNRSNFNYTHADVTITESDHTTGTATFTNGSTTVTGSGTNWPIGGFSGSQIKNDTNGVWYTISSITSTTSLTLTTTYSGATTGLQAYTISGGGEFGYSVAAGDVSHSTYATWGIGPQFDDIDDVIVGAPGANQVFIFNGRSDWPSAMTTNGISCLSGETYCDQEMGYAPGRCGHQVAAADVTSFTSSVTTHYGDDVIYTCPENTSAYTFINSNDGDYSESWGSDYAYHGSSLTGYSLAIGDVNANGNNDIVTGAPTYNTNDGRVSIYLDNGTSNWSSSAVPDVLITGETDSHFGTSVAIGDLDADGDDDIAVGAPTYDTDGLKDMGRAYIFYNDRNGSFPTTAATADEIITGPDSGTDYDDYYFGQAVSIGDLNLDGRKDLAVTREFFTTVQQGWINGYFNDGDGYYPTSYSDYDVEYYLNHLAWAYPMSLPHKLHFGDLSGDGYDDLLVGVPSLDYQRGYLWYYQTPRIGCEPPNQSSLTITDTGGFTNDSTPTLSIAYGYDTGQSTAVNPPAYGQFSCDNINWSGEIALSASSTPVTTSSFNMTIAGAGCNSTNGTKTIYTKIRNNCGDYYRMDAVSDSTYYDTTGPTVTINSGAYVKSPASLTVYANTPNDGSGSADPYDYYFTYYDNCSLTNPRSYSGWTTNNYYTITANFNEWIGFAVMARDELDNAGSNSACNSVWTAANTPAAPTVAAVSTSSLSVDVNPNSNPTSTEFAIYVEAGATCDGSGGYYVSAAGGNNGSTPVWQTDSVWATKTVTGLSENNQYSFCVKARNGDNVETSFGSSASKYTLINTPSATTVQDPVSNGCTINEMMVDQNGVPFSGGGSTGYTVSAKGGAYGGSYGTYFIEFDYDDGYNHGFVSAGENWGFVDDFGYTYVSGLSPNTQYCYNSKSRNGDGVETGYGTEACGYTLAHTPVSPTTSNQTTSSMTSGWSSGGTPTANGYVLSSSSDCTANLGWDDDVITDTADDIREVYCPSSSVCYAVGRSDNDNSNYGQIHRSTDGGKTWPNDYGSASADYGAFDCSDYDNCWAMGWASKFAYSTNASATTPTWTTTGTYGATSNNPQALDMVSSSEGRVVLVGGEIRHIVGFSGGSGTWYSETSGTTQTLNDIHCTSSSNCWVVGNAGVVLYTTNGTANQATWTAAADSGVETTNALQDIYMANGTTGYAVGLSGTILKTTDAGVNWTTQTSPTSQNLYAIDCTSTTNCTAGGNGGVVIHTTDGGSNWVLQPSNIANSILDIELLDTYKGLAVGGIYGGGVPPGLGQIMATRTTTTSMNETGMNPNVSYTRYVCSLNAEWNQGPSALTIGPTYTSASTPDAPIVNNPGATTLDVNPVSGGAEYGMAVYVEVGGGGTNCDGTGGYYLNLSGGNNGSTAVFDSDANWGTVTANSLTPNTEYNFCSKAWNVDLDQTAFGSMSSDRTLANIPSAPTVSGATFNTLDVNVNPNSNPVGTEFAIYAEQGAACDGTGGLGYVTGTGAIGAETWDTEANWGNKTVTGLSTDTQYSFCVKARNGDTTPVETAFGTAASGTTSGPPVVTSLTITDAEHVSTSGYTTSETPQVTITYSGTTPTQMQFSCNNSSWTTLTAYASPTTAFDMVSIVNGCNTSDGSKTIYVRLYNGGGYSNTTNNSDTTYFDTTGPSWFEEEPSAAADSVSQITVSAGNVEEFSGSGAPYQYYYDRYTSGTCGTFAAASGWISNTTYAFSTGLSPNTEYGFYVSARDELGNTSYNTSTCATAYTLANSAINPGHTNQTQTSMRWTWASGGAQTDYMYGNGGDGCSTNNCTLGPTTNTYWDESSLTSDTYYIRCVCARNGDNEKAEPLEISTSTSADQATTPVGHDTQTTQGINWTWTSGGNQSYFVMDNSPDCLSPEFTWISPTNYNESTGLNANTAYTRYVCAQNDAGDRETASPLQIGPFYTSANTPTTPGVTNIASDSIRWTWASGGAETDYAFEYTTPGWYLQTTGETDSIYDVFFVDENVGWFVADNHIVRKTTNGGGTWVAQSSTGFAQTEIQCFDANNCWMAGVGGYVNKTVNGGVSWDYYDIPTATNIFAMGWANSTTGWVADLSGQIWKNSTGNLTDWTLQYDHSTKGFMGLHVVDANTVYAVGNDGLIMKTINGGTDWTDQSEATLFDFNAIYCTDANTCIIAGQEMYKTTNGGTDWFVSDTGLSENMWDIHCPTSDFCITLGANTYKTENGGASWSVDGDPFGTSWNRGVYCLDEDNCWGTSDNGKVAYRTSGLAVTTNTYYDESGLTPGTSYNRNVYARNGDGDLTPVLALGPASTLPSLTSVTISDTSGFTNDSTPPITIAYTGGAPTHVALSCNGGTNWSSDIAYPGDNELNTSTDTDFNITTGATGCSSTNESKTITVRVKNASGYSTVQSDTTYYDITGPTVTIASAVNAPNDNYITVTANTAVDPDLSGPLPGSGAPFDYYFDYYAGATCGGSSLGNSGWLLNDVAVFDFTGLDSNAQYSFKVTARDELDNQGAQSVCGGATYTSADIPDMPTVSSPTTSSLDVDPVTGGAEKEMAIYVEQGSDCDGAGGLGYVEWNAGGSGGIVGTASWATDSNWTADYTVTGLSVHTQYSFCVKARNEDNDETDFGETTSDSTANTVPSFTAGPSDGGSSGSTPTNEGDDVVFTATATDGDGDTYWLLICSDNSTPPTASGTGPECYSEGETYGLVGPLTSGSPATTTGYPAPSGGGEEEAWYAYVCDAYDCSAANQNTGDNGSPFVVNHQPVAVGTISIGDTTGGTGTIEPGNTVYFNQAVSDDDVLGGQDLLNMYVCETDSFTPGVGCDGTTICSVTGVNPVSDNAECSSASLVPVPTDNDTYHVYVFIQDPGNLTAFYQVGTQDKTYAVTDVAPVLVAYTATDSPAPIAGGSDTVDFTALIQDDNGEADITTAEGFFFDNDAVTTAQGGVCSESENDCYKDTSCTLNTAAGNSAQVEAQCQVTVWYNANQSDNWEVRVNPTDSVKVTDFADSNLNISNPLLSGIDVPEAGISYGSSLQLGETSSEKSITLQNVGNYVVDTAISGTDMTYSTYSIPRANQKWSGTTGFNYGVGNTLVETPTSTSAATGCFDASLPVRTDHTSTALDDTLYWLLQIPSTGLPAGSYTGSNTIQIITCQ